MKSFSDFKVGQSYLYLDSAIPYTCLAVWDNALDSGIVVWNKETRIPFTQYTQSQCLNWRPMPRPKITFYLGVIMEINGQGQHYYRIQYEDTKEQLDEHARKFGIQYVATKMIEFEEPE